MLSILRLDKPNITDFAYERNELLKKAKTDWVLFLDSDEELTKELSKEINQKIIDTKCNGFYIKRKIYFCGVLSGEDKMLKLARKSAGKWRRRVHEVWDLKGRVETLDNYIVHNTASTLREYLSKVDFQSTLHAEEVLREGKRSSLLKIITYPLGNFVVYFIKSKNIVFSIMKSLHSYLSWTKMYFRTDQNKF